MHKTSNKFSSEVRDRAVRLVLEHRGEYPSFSRRFVYDEIPYVLCNARDTGFRYQDWHWNCETIASGYIHELAVGAVYFYRKKHSMSKAASAAGLNAVMPPSRFFEKLDGNDTKING